MIFKIKPRIYPKSTTLPRRPVQREVVIKNKNGRDSFEDVYLGSYPRASFMSMIEDLFMKFCSKNSGRDT